MLLLDTSSLSETGISCWRLFLQLTVRQLSLNQKVETVNNFAIDKNEELVFISSSQALSRRLLLNYKHIYIAPRHPPRCIDLYLHQQLLAKENGNKVDSPDDKLNTWLQTLTTASPQVSLVSSVFSADTYLDSFLKNIRKLEGYNNYEHFLIRPGSPGDEHSALIDHVRHHPGAIYINLKHDPGLYQVWNIGVRLATAPYLSNANLDDRRAPDHVARMCSCLDQHLDVAVASSRLFATDQPNLPWNKSAACPQMFSNVQGGRYAVQDLVKQNDCGAVSQNLPHCMPVWRRRLHADYGEFDEKNFGPSADWEFWLRVGVQGETFFFLPEALGLYLQHPDSYWHRQEESKQEHFDQRILRRYAGLLYQANSSFHQSLAMDIALAHKLLTAHDYGSGICWLLRSLKRGWQAGGAAQELLTALCQKFLGCAPLEWGPLLAQWNGKSDDLLSVMVDLVHNIKGAVGDRLYRLFDFACLDWYAMTGERQWLSLRAFWARLAGYGPLEKVILKSLFAESPRWFWQHLQSVYRFTAPLKEMVTLLGCMRGATTSDLKATSDIRLIFFPDYRSSNSYTELLYRTIVDQGGLVTAASTVADLAALSPLPGRKNVIHIHWIQAILKDCDASQLTKRVDDFLELLTRQQQKGFALYWTVHNRLSHDGYKPAFESVFRRRLAALVDRIYLHHPLAVELLEWLDDQDKICLVEHGRYTTPTYIDDDPQLSRKVTGIDAQGTVLCHLGLIRDYKGLEETLPVLLNSLSSENTMQVVVAGRVVGASLQKWLQKQRHPRLMIKRERLSLEMLERYMHAADYGFLSYRDILTSGSLFHWFSCGRPVIAPAKGTIPAYVVDGWNGFLYSDETDLGNVIERATSLTMSQRKQLGANALSVANTLNWEFF